MYHEVVYCYVKFGRVLSSIYLSKMVGYSYSTHQSPSFSARMKLNFNYFIFPFTTISKLLKIPLRSIHLLQHQIKHSHVKSTYYHHSNKFSKIKFRFKFLLSHNINILLYFEFRTKINLSFINSTSYQQTNLPTMVNNGVKNYFLFFNFFHSSQL